MSNYNPIPPRAWSRVENPCVFIVPGSTYENAFIPLTGQVVSQAQADYETKQIYKGNILQYKGNSARFTKSQRYSQLARMAGPNRTKVFATQSQTYSNPNTTGLLRVGFSTYQFPNEIPGAPNNISGPFAYGIPNPYDCSGNSIQDGGTLVCGTFANPCSGEIIKRGVNPATICYPASASNVPGPALLCWNNKVQTWFPRQRYFMNNSGTKWPVNYKGFVSAIKLNTPYLPPDSLIISNITYDGLLSDVTIQWNQPIINNKCTNPIIKYNIYLDSLLVVSNISSLSYVFENLNVGTIYTFGVQTSAFITGSTSLSSIVTISSGLLFNTTGNPSLSYSSGKYTLFYANSGTIEILEPSVNSFDLILVGGGGGGGGGKTDDISTGNRIGGGGGGGGETIITTSNAFTTNNPYTISIGNGGNGGTPGNPGTIGQPTSIILNTTLTALPGLGGSVGAGGNGGGSGTGGPGGPVDTNGTSGSLSGTSRGGGGGGGGCNNTITVPISFSGYGGGGGGVAVDGNNLSNTILNGGLYGETTTSSSFLGGFSGNYNGYDGSLSTAGWGGDISNGSSGVYGGGGGGGRSIGTNNGDNFPRSGGATSGGTGGKGFCVISFTYP